MYVSYLVSILNYIPYSSDYNPHLLFIWIFEIDIFNDKWNLTLIWNKFYSLNCIWKLKIWERKNQVKSLWKVIVPFWKHVDKRTPRFQMQPIWILGTIIFNWSCWKWYCALLTCQFFYFRKWMVQKFQYRENHLFPCWPK